MFFLLIIGGYLVFILLAVYFCHRMGGGLFVKVVIATLLLLLPFGEQIYGKWLMWSFASQHTPLQKINRHIDEPGSVLWIDNVWPGFDAYYRNRMVENYLDGVRLKTLGLNDGEQKLYVYRAEVEDFSESEKLRPKVEAAKEKYSSTLTKTGKLTKDVAAYQLLYFDKKRNFQTQRKKELASILKRVEIYDLNSQGIAEDAPDFKFKVEWNAIPLTDMQSASMWCDIVTITDIDNMAELAFNKRCLQYSPRMAIIYAGESPFEGGVSIGDQQALGFDDKVLFEYADINTRELLKNTFRRNAYRRAVLRWEEQ